MMTCKHTMREGETRISVTQPLPYLCSFCQMEQLQEENARLRELVVEIAMHFDPMFGCIDLHRLDDREWMSKAAKAVGEDAIYPWKKADKAATQKKTK